MREGWELLTRLLMKYDLMAKIPFDCGRERISRTQLHMIEAIGKGRGRTVTSLADYFMVTKGAVSQVVKKGSLTLTAFLRILRGVAASAGRSCAFARA
jgi:DNA-binding MarR family transcriptional regulator